jgi:hypothetical protein
MTHRTFERRALVGLVFYVVLVLAVFGAASSSSGCGRYHPGDDVAAALNAYARTINPALTLVRNGCAEADRATLELERARLITRERADQLTGASRTRCDALVETFEAMRLTHDRATEAYQHGEYARAREQLAALADLWADAETDGGTP